MSDPMPTRPAAGRGGKKAAAADAAGTIVAEVMEELSEITVRGHLEKYPEKFRGVLTALGFSPEIVTKFGGILLGEFARFLLLAIIAKTGTKSIAASAFANTIDDVIKGGVSAFAERARLLIVGAPAAHTTTATPAGATPAHGAPAASTTLAGTPPATPAAKVEAKPEVKRSLLVLAFIAAFGRSVKLSEADEANEIFMAYPELVERLALEWYITHFNEKPEITVSGALSLKTEKNLATIRKFTDEEKRETIQILFATGAGKLSPLTNLEALFNRLTGKQAEAEERAPVTEAEEKLEAATASGDILAKVKAEKELKAAKKALKKKDAMPFWQKAAIGAGIVFGISVIAAVLVIVNGIANLK